MTNLDIAQKYKISLPSVKRLARKLRLPKKYSDEYPRRQYLLKKSVEMYQRNMSTFKIGAKLGINEETVRNYLDKQNVPRRWVNGLDKETMVRQNDIIKKMYLSGAILRDIESASGLKSHGVEKRLKAMGIARNRHTPKPIGNTHDEKIKEMFMKGDDLKAIAEKLDINVGTVRYHISRILFRGLAFKIKYMSPLTKRWRTSNKTFYNLRQLRNSIRMKHKYLGRDVRMIVLPIMPLVKIRRQHIEQYPRMSGA